VVSVLNGAPAKVRCRTCHSDHDFRNEQPPPPKVDARKAALFKEVLEKVSPGDAAAAAAVGEDPELDLAMDAESEPEVEVEAEVEAEAVAADPVDETPKPKRGRGRPKK
jgi:hypothetical protein